MRQKKPYNLTLPHNVAKGWCWGPHSSHFSHGWRFAAFAMDRLNSETAYNTAYADLVSKLGDNASIGVTLVQWREADQMIRNRGGQLLRFAGALARRNPLGVAASLGLKVADVQKMMRTKYGTARKLSDLWLELWFGWKPAVSDIYTACQVFDHDVPWGTYSGAASASVAFQQFLGPFQESIDMRGKASCRIQVDVRVVNPNVRLLQQFGLANPAVVAFDAFPWSFTLGWFSNVSTWLGSFTDFAGLETSNGYVSRKVVLDGKTYWPSYGEAYDNFGKSIAASRILTSTVPRPSFEFKFKDWMPTRGLTAISLLTQKLPKV